MGRTHLVFSDRHCAPGLDLSYHDAIGKLIVDVKPDVVIDNGDGADMPSLCVAPSTLILKSDLTWVEAGILNIGDEVIGFDENPPSNSFERFRRFRKSIITQNTRFISPKGFVVKTTQGDVVCSADHMFLSYKKGGAKKGFRNPKKLKVGYRISSLGSSWTEQCPLNQSEVGYLKGFFDGEAYYGNGRLSWSQNDGPVADYVKALVEKLGVVVKSYREEGRLKLGHYYVQGSYLDSWKVLHFTRPLRLLPKILNEIEGKVLSKCSGIEDAIILSIEEINDVEVIGLETSTGTYISNNLFSHNCAYDKNTRRFQGRSYGADIAAAVEGNDRIWSVVRRAKKKLPYTVTTIGNHEYRINRALDLSPELEGAVSINDLQLDNYYDTVVSYEGNTPGVIEIDGVYYAHYLVSGIKGLPISGEHPAAYLVSKQGASCTVGHSHLRDFSHRSGVDGRTRLGLVTGTASLHRPHFAGRSSQLWWQGVVICHNVENGNYDPEFISIQRLMEIYR